MSMHLPGVMAESDMTKALVVGLSPPAKGHSDLCEYLRRELQLKVLEASVETLKQADLTGIAVVIATATECPALLRSATIPVVVCDPSALYDLGLTAASAGVDFGMGAKDDTFVIYDDTHELAAGLRGFVALTKGEKPIGWGKPSPDAEVVATLGTNIQRRPAVFVHRQDSAMVGLPAPQKRVACLIGSNNIEHLNENGWALFGACVRWALAADAATQVQDAAVRSHPGVVAAKPPHVELSHALSLEDYKVWVHEQISNKLFNKFVAIFSFIGLAGIIVIGSLAGIYINQEIKTSNIEKGRSLKKEITADLESTVREKVASTLLNVTGIRKEINEAARDELSPEKIAAIAAQEVKKFVEQATDPKRIDELVQTAIQRSPETLEVLVTAASKQIRTSGGLQSIILEQVRPTALDKAADLNQRARALQLLIIFERKEEKLRSNLREILMTDDVFHSDLYEIALKTYEPSDSTDAERTLFSHVINLSASKKKVSSETGQGILTFISRFPEDFADTVAKTLVDGNVAPSISYLLIESMSKLKGDKVVDTFVGLATNNGQNVSDLGWNGLALLQDRKISFDTRRKSLEKLWPIAWKGILAADADLSKRVFSRQGEFLQARTLHDELNRLRDFGILHRGGYGHISSVVPQTGIIDEQSADKIMSRLKAVRRYGDITEFGYRLVVSILGRRIGKLRVLARRKGESRGTREALESLRRQMESSVYRQLRDALERSDSREALRVLERSRDRMSPEAYITLSSLFESPSISPTIVVDLIERVRRLEQPLAAPQPSSRPVVDATLKNWVIVNLFPSAADTDSWKKILDSKLWPTDSDSKEGQQRIDNLLTAWVQRLRTAKEPSDASDSYRLLADTALQQRGLEKRARLVKALKVALQYSPEESLPGFSKIILQAPKSRGAVSALATALRRETATAGSFTLRAHVLGQTITLKGEAPSAADLYLEALAQALGHGPRVDVGILREVSDRVTADKAADKIESRRFGLKLLDLFLQNRKGKPKSRATLNALEDSGLARQLLQIANSAEAGDLASESKRLFGLTKSWIGWIQNLAGAQVFTENQQLRALPDQGRDDRSAWFRLDSGDTREFWIKTGKTAVEATIVASDAMTVLDRIEIRAKKEREIVQKKAAYLRLRPQGEEQPEIAYEVRDRLPKLQVSKTLKDAKVIAVNKLHRGDFAKSREGWVRFRGVRGTNYLFETDKLSRGADTSLTLTKADGSNLKYNDDKSKGNYASQIEWFFSAPETVGIKIRNPRGGFDLIARAVGTLPRFLQVTASTERKTAITLVENDSAVIVDLPKNTSASWVKIRLSADQVYRVSSDTAIDVLDPAGVALDPLKAIRQIPGQPAVLSRVYYIFTQKNGEHSFRVRRRGRASRGVFRIRPIDGATRARPHELTLSAMPDSPAIDLEAKSDHPGYLLNTTAAESFLAVSAKEGVTYSISVARIAESKPVTIEIVRRDEKGKLKTFEIVRQDEKGTLKTIKEFSDNDQKVTWKCPKSGRYYLRLKSKGRIALLLNSGFYGGNRAKSGFTSRPLRR